MTPFRPLIGLQELRVPTRAQPDSQPPGKDSPFLPLLPPGHLSPSGEEMAACWPSLAPPWFVPLILFQNGEVECSFTPCPELDCPREEWWLGPGQCCYACREPVPMTGKGHPACIPAFLSANMGWIMCTNTEKSMAPHSSTLPGKSHGWRSLVGCSPWGR